MHDTFNCLSAAVGLRAQTPKFTPGSLVLLSHSRLTSPCQHVHPPSPSPPSPSVHLPSSGPRSYFPNQKHALQARFYCVALSLSRSLSRSIDRSLPSLCLNLCQTVSSSLSLSLSVSRPPSLSLSLSHSVSLHLSISPSAIISQSTSL